MTETPEPEEKEELTPEERVDAILELAEEYMTDGEIELVDGDAMAISEGDDNGAYVLAWVWVDFCGTALDKNDAEDE